MIVLDPCWLTQSVCGELLSADFFARSASTFAAKGGSYSLNEFQASVATYFKFTEVSLCGLPQITFFHRQMAAPEWDAIDLLPLLESLGLCTQVFACVTHRYRGLF